MSNSDISASRIYTRPRLSAVRRKGEREDGEGRGRGKNGPVNPLAVVLLPFATSPRGEGGSSSPFLFPSPGLSPRLYDRASSLSACVAPQSDVNAMQISNGGEIEIERASERRTRMQVHYRRTRLPNVPGGAINGPAASVGRGVEGERGPAPIPLGGSEHGIPCAEPADKFNGRPLNRLNRDSDEIFTCGKKDAFYFSLVFLSLFLSFSLSIFIPRSSLFTSN